MNDLASFLPGPVLAIDVGSGTQDVIYASPGQRQRNWPKLVLPSPAKMIAARIKKATANGLAVHLGGSIMGGGFFGAVKAHLDAGLALSASPRAALSVFDDPARLEAMGARLREEPPTGAQVLRLADFDAGWWKEFFHHLDLPYPELVMAAAQDHGHHPAGDNRGGRFRLWERFLTRFAGDPLALVYHVDDIPAELTRLRALAASIGSPRARLADTGSAAVLGILCEPELRGLADTRGLVAVNVGNSHILAMLVFQGRIHGVYEHHTGMRAPKDLAADLAAFSKGELTNESVHASGGHGCLTLALPEGAGFADAAVIGPRRELLEGLLPQAVFPCPGEDMMTAGALGLLSALKA